MAGRGDGRLFGGGSDFLDCGDTGRLVNPNAIPLDIWWEGAEMRWQWGRKQAMENGGKTGSITIHEAIAEVERELALRKAVYPKMIAGGKLKREAAERQWLRLKAALSYLERAREMAKRAA